MDGDSWLRVLVYLICLFGGAYFAAAESAITAMNKIRIKSLAEDGNKRAKIVLEISGSFEKAITTLLIGTNIVHIGCATLGTVLAIGIWGDVYGDSTVTTYATIVTTVLVFLISEMIPKSYAKANSEKTAMSLGPSLRTLMKILGPVAFVFTSVSRFISKLFPQNDKLTYSEEELATIIDTVEEEGVLDEERSDLLQSAMEFPKTAVSDVMTVKEDVVSINARDPMEKILENIRKINHSRIPVYKDDENNIVGLLHIRSYLREYIRKGRAELRNAMTEPFIVPPDAPIDELFEKMRSGKIYIAVVKDKNEFLGIATIEDFLEELVGEIWDEDDIYNENFIKLGGHSYEVAGSMNLGEVFSLMGYKIKTRKIQTRPFPPGRRRLQAACPRRMIPLTAEGFM